MNIGQKVKLNFGIRQVGEIVEIQPALKINGVVMSAKRHKVKWDSGDMSGWLKDCELKALDMAEELLDNELES